jgi:signal transduction histidine kinase
MDFLQRPLLATDIAAFVYLLLSVLFFVLWRRDREPGMGWLGSAYLLLTLIYAYPSAMMFADSRVHPIGGFLGGLANAALSCGIIYFLSSPGAPRRWLVMVAVTGCLFVPAALLLGFGLRHPWVRLPLIVTCIAIVIAAYDAFAKTEKGQRWVVGAVLGSMLAFPLTYTSALAAGVDVANARLYILFPGLLFGLLLLSVSMVRRSYALAAENRKRVNAEHALIAANASLEATVAHRTADLQNIVAGLESFNRSVSHDLQGSLGGMAGLARIAQDAVRPESCDLALARRVLPMIVKEAERSTELVTALLTLARVGDQHVSKTTVDLNALTQEVIASITLVKRDAALPRFVVNALPLVHADINLLRPALTNLISNAVKFCGYRPQGCVDVLARADATTQETIIQVRDNGIGFCAATASELFQPFARLHGQDFAGHGVGLSIVRRAIERQGGRVWAESELGKGASFFLALPSLPTELPTMARTLMATLGPLPSLGRADATPTVMLQAGG